MQLVNSNGGYLTILVFGIVAAVIGLLIGIATADLVAPDDLSGLGVAVIWLIALGSVGAGIGVGVGLTAKGQAKPALTAVLATPAVFVLSLGALFVIARMELGASNQSLYTMITWFIELTAVAAGLLGARWVALAIPPK